MAALVYTKIVHSRKISFPISNYFSRIFFVRALLLAKSFSVFSRHPSHEVLWSRRDLADTKNIQALEEKRVD